MVATVNLSSSVLSHDAAEVERLVSDFETASISPADWKHRDHVAVATWYLLTRPGEAAAVEAMAESLKRFARAAWDQAIAGRGYHDAHGVLDEGHQPLPRGYEPRLLAHRPPQWGR
jgi:hypothetical protein